eukprot:TRINITY_DN14715_c0_g1_i1.p1 TRINITY_DN14715_c0_g1~~TRINITY_DN14715_c0_g1_i1.p1  ORF type:complete len:284 (+),score=52.89 TRINITY_DN14715_c0_g1_i1:74-925(+)
MVAEESGNSSGSGRPAGPLPVRYVCQSCGTCIATSEHFLESSGDADKFSVLFNAADACKDGTKTVSCPYCETALGVRGDGSYSLRRDRVVKRIDQLEILLCSLKAQEMQELSPILTEAFPHSNITQRVLQKAELRGFQLSGARPCPDLVVVVHRNEGRTLLTDRNGFYHDVLGSAWQLTRGNVLVVLTRTVVKAEADLYDEKLLRSLSTQGDQPTIGAISALGRVLTWESSPSQPQLTQLRTLTAKAYYREAPSSEATQGIPVAWVVKANSAKAVQTNWCMLL